MYNITMLNTPEHVSEIIPIIKNSIEKDSLQDINGHGVYRWIDPTTKEVYYAKKGNEERGCMGKIKMEYLAYIFLEENNFKLPYFTLDSNLLITTEVPGNKILDLIGNKIFSEDLVKKILDDPMRLAREKVKKEDIENHINSESKSLYSLTLSDLESFAKDEKKEEKRKIYLDKLERLKETGRNEILCYQHGDEHLGNIFLDEEKGDIYYIDPALTIDEIERVFNRFISLSLFFAFPESDIALNNFMTMYKVACLELSIYYEEMGLQCNLEKFNIYLGTNLIRMGKGFLSKGNHKYIEGKENDFINLGFDIMTGNYAT